MSGTSQSTPVDEPMRSEWIHSQPAAVRIVVLWVVTMVIVFASFGLHLWLGDGYNTIPDHPSPDEPISRLLVVIWSINLANAAFIALVSTLFRFGPINVGTAYLAVQAVLIGRIAGLNSFEHPMPSVGEGMVRFLQVGLWELTAYTIVAAVTMTKARWVADRIGAKQWRQQRSWRDLPWDRTDRRALGCALVLILIAGLVEAALLSR